MALVEEPVTRLPQKTGRVLVYELTSRNARSRDWRGLACFIGFTSRHIQLIEENQKPEKAWLVFEAWDRTGKSSIRLLIIALKQLGYQSSLDILMDSEELRGSWLIVMRMHGVVFACGRCQCLPRKN